SRLNYFISLKAPRSHSLTLSLSHPRRPLLRIRALHAAVQRPQCVEVLVRVAGGVEGRVEMDDLLFEVERARDDRHAGFYGHEVEAGLEVGHFLTRAFRGDRDGEGVVCAEEFGPLVAQAGLAFSVDRIAAGPPEEEADGAVEQFFFAQVGDLAAEGRPDEEA